MTHCPLANMYTLLVAESEMKHEEEMNTGCTCGFIGSILSNLSWLMSRGLIATIVVVKWRIIRQNSPKPTTLNPEWNMTWKLVEPLP